MSIPSQQSMIFNKLKDIEKLLIKINKNLEPQGSSKLENPLFPNIKKDVMSQINKISTKESDSGFIQELIKQNKESEKSIKDNVKRVEKAHKEFNEAIDS